MKQLAALEMSRLYPAGTATPWNNVSDVLSISSIIGVPPHRVDSEAFRAETRMIQEGLEPENATVRDILGSINDEASRRAKALAETVIHNPNPRGTYDE
jgi:hypothetical protein